jgi:ABC-2 type transporter
VTLSLSLVIGTLYWKVGQADNSDTFNLQSHFGGIMICLFFVLLGAAQPALVYFPDERPIFLREYSTEHYSVLSYFLSRLLAEIIVTGGQVVCMVTIMYYMMALNGSVLTYYTTTFALALSGTAIAVWIGVLSRGNTKTAQQLVPIILMPQLLFSGFFISPSLIPSFLRWYGSICSLTYAVRILVLEEFKDCGESYFAQRNCDRLIETMQTNPEDVPMYWFALVAIFVAFRLLALVMLKRSAVEFY